MSNYRDFQLLMYVSADKFLECIQFYESVFGEKSFYGWNSGENDRGEKFNFAGTKIVILTQENPFPEYGPMHFQIEVDDIVEIYDRIASNKSVKITQKLFIRPYGWHMFRMVDPAGHHINIYQIPKK